MQDKVNECITSEDAVKAIHEIIIKNDKSDIVWLAYYQSQIIRQLKEKESFISIVLKLNMSKSTTLIPLIFAHLICAKIDGCAKG